MPALRHLNHLNLFNEQVANNLLNAAMSPNGRLRGPAVETLQYFYATIGCYGYTKNSTTAKLIIQQNKKI
jgi:hypothetical protein